MEQNRDGLAHSYVEAWLLRHYGYMATRQRRPRVDLPDALVAAVTERRVIPFIGAGFSQQLGLPGWEELLIALTDEIEGLPPYSEIKEAANGDFLQIAEYLFIKSDRHIGPLRHVIEGRLKSDVAPSVSPAHVELANLGAQRIYTTNYDEMLEKAYRELGLPIDVVATPKSVATTQENRTQIVKYHGDLRHENTLVLTESAYYRRLDFESPMDLKFRSDLLGRSVLFMGYSFRDVNIRLIWFKLMQMMRDIPESDRQPSYIVRLGPNPVMDTLYRDVGLTPLILDPTGETRPGPEGDELLGDFLYRLAQAGAGREEVIPGSQERLFVSSALLKRLERSFVPSLQLFEPYLRRAPGPDIFSQIYSRRVPRELTDLVAKANLKLLKGGAIGPANTVAAILLAAEEGPSETLTQYVAQYLQSLLRAAHRIDLTQDPILNGRTLPWSIIWEGNYSSVRYQEAVKSFARELNFHESGQADFDLFGVALIALLGDQGVLKIDQEIDAETHAENSRNVARLTALYPVFDEWRNLSSGEVPYQLQFEALSASVEAVSDSDDDLDIPFESSTD